MSPSSLPVPSRSKSLRSTALAVLATTAAAFMAPVAHADYLWLQREGAQARAYTGEVARRSAALPALKAPRAYLADGKDLPLAREAGHIDVTAPEGQDLRLTTSVVGDKGALTFYQARHGRSETRAANDLELVPTTPGGNTFKLVWKGQTVAASQVNVDTSAGWQRTLAPAKDGTVSLETPFPGLYVLEVTARVNGAATVDGTKYEDVRHTATLSFEVAR